MALDVLACSLCLSLSLSLSPPVVTKYYLPSHRPAAGTRGVCSPARCRAVELPEAVDFRETTSLTVEELSDGIRCFTVRPIHSQRWGLPLLAGSLLFAALPASLPLPLVVVVVLFALGATARAAFSVRLESLLVMEGIGLQLTTRFATGREKVVFVETSAVSEVRSDGRRHARRSRCQSRACHLHRCSSARRCGWTAASSTWRACCTATTHATSQGRLVRVRARARDRAKAEARVRVGLLRGDGACHQPRCAAGAEAGAVGGERWGERPAAAA